MNKKRIAPSKVSQTPHLARLIILIFTFASLIRMSQGQDTIVNQQVRDANRNMYSTLGSMLQNAQAAKQQREQEAFIKSQAELERQPRIEMESSRSSDQDPKSVSGDERAEIEEVAYQRALRDFKTQQSNAERRKRVEALVRTAVNQFARSLTDSNIESKYFTRAFDSNAVELVRNNFIAAEKKYPVEASIIKSHIEAASEFIQISSGLKEFSEDNPTHAWVENFCRNICNQIKDGSEEEKTKDGKTFLSLWEFAGQVQTNSEATLKYWTISDIQILERISVDTHAEVNRKIANLEAAGFVRKAKSNKGDDTEERKTAKVIETESR